MPTPEAYEYLVSIARELNIPLDPEDQNVPQPGDLHGARQDLLAARKARESVIAAPRGRMRFLKYLLLRLLQVYTRDHDRVESLTLSSMENMLVAIDEATERIEELKRRVASVEQLTAPCPWLSDDAYVRFEEVFRGQRSEIMLRQEQWVDRLLPFAKKGICVDLGCGRGEWLSLMNQRGVSAIGFDANSIMVDACRKRGLAASTADVLAALGTFEGPEVGLITLFQVAEHLTPGYLMETLRRALRVLVPGGALALETLNPYSLYAMRFYYQDLSHSQPLARETLAWMLKEVGFDSVDVIQSSPATRELGVDQQCQMCQELASQDQEYLVIGVKA